MQGYLIATLVPPPPSTPNKLSSPAASDAEAEAESDNEPDRRE